LHKVFSEEGTLWSCSGSPALINCLQLSPLHTANIISHETNNYKRLFTVLLLHHCCIQ